MTLGDFQNEQFEAIGKVAQECRLKGMPLIGHVYPKGESVPVDQRASWENIAYCVRSACELGMDIVKLLIPEIRNHGKSNLLRTEQLPCSNSGW